MGHPAAARCQAPPVGQETHRTADLEVGATNLSALAICRRYKYGKDLIRPQIHNRFEDGLRLGEDGVFEDRLVGDVGVHSADAADRGV